MLNEIWALDQLFTNYLLAQQKLIFKQRNGSKVTKRYDRACTPYERTLSWDGLADKDRRAIETTMAQVRPGELYRTIAGLTARLEHLALSKAPAPVKAPVNWAFNSPPNPEILPEAMNQSWRRI